MFGRKKKNREMAAEMPQMTERPRVVRTVPELATFSYTDQGRREYQQDAVYVTPSKKFAANRKTRVMAVVCDGMGGMADGGKASRTAIQMMINGFQNVQNQPQMNIPGFFRSAIVTIDKTIASFPKENGRGSGTTMVAAIAEENKLYWASVGDSRIYIIRENNNQTEMRQITRDHSLVEEMVRLGEMDKADAKDHPDKNIITRAVGVVPELSVDFFEVELKPGDTVLMCSDGLTNMIEDEEIKKIVLGQRDIVEKAEKLIDTANENGGKDNITVVLIEPFSDEVKEC